MWPHMESMGAWMAVWWALGLAALVLFLWIVGRASGGPSRTAEETPEQILKRRYARGDVEREEYQRRLDDLKR